MAAPRASFTSMTVCGQGLSEMAAPGPDPRQSLFCAGRSRMVSAAKIVLPLAALGLLSTLFLISDKADPDAAIPYAEVDVEARAREPRVTGADYAGVTAGGTALELRARDAVPGSDGAIAASGLELVWQTRDGMRADLVAASGRSDPAAGVIALSGGVVMTTSTGYRLSTDLIETSTDRSRITAPGAVQAVAPFGEITAGSLQLEQGAEGGPHVLDFTGGVRLIYTPQE